MSWTEGLQQVSILIGIWVAIAGLNSWRKDHTGRRKIEVAEETLALFYEAADAISHVRHPASFGYELQDVKQAEGESDECFEARKNASIVYVRLRQYQDMLNKIHAMRYRFMAQIGREEAKPFEELREVVNSIKMSADMLARLWPRQQFRTKQEFEKHQDRIRKYEDIFWSGPDGDDEINRKVQCLIHTLELTCWCVVSGKYDFFSLHFGRKPQLTNRSSGRP